MRQVTIQVIPGRRLHAYVFATSKRLQMTQSEFIRSLIRAEMERQKLPETKVEEMLAAFDAAQAEREQARASRAMDREMARDFAAGKF